VPAVRHAQEAAIVTSSGYPLLRSELHETLREGDALLLRAMAGRNERFDKGRKIIHAGEESETVYWLRTGWLARTRTIEDGRRQIMTIFLPGDLIGVKNILLSEQPDMIECLTNVTVNAIDHVQARRLFKTNDTIALRMLFQLAEDERRLHTWVLGLGRGNANERIAAMLLDFHGRLHRIGLVDGDGTFRLPMTQQEIGDYLGLTVVHVNRVLRRYREAGLATVKGGTAVIHDVVALQRIAAPLQDIFERTTPEFGGSPENSAKP
jgi:CRP/FNR family transcriptional regulator, anaerobic regulatory protein